MARPLSVLYNVSGDFAGLQEMNDVRLEYPVYQICSAIASQDSNGGNLTIGINDGETSIGTYVDTYYADSIGTHPANTTVQQVVYELTQKLTAGTISPTRPVEYSTVANASSTTTGIRPMTDDSIKVEFFDRVLLALASRSIGSYVMQLDSPALPGETWVTVHTIVDTSQGGSSETKIWRKIGDTAPTEYPTLRIVSTNGDLREMSDAEIKTLFDSYANYVISTGRGKYRLQETNPATSGQTWYKMGTSVRDRRVTLQFKTYTGAYNRNYVGTYQRNYVGAYTGSYKATFTGTYTGTYRKTFATSQGSYYTGTKTESRDVAYVGIRNKAYQSGVELTYQGAVSKSYSSYEVISTVKNISTAYLWLRVK